MVSDKNRKKISIGVEDFKEIIDRNGYFVDKTPMLAELMESNTKVTLFTRPRRFGKTLNQSMIQRFFEKEITEGGGITDNRYLFDGLAVSSCGGDIMEHCQQYPVITISLKSAKQPDYQMAYSCLIDDIAREFRRHSYVLETDSISEAQKEEFRQLCDKAAAPDGYAKSFLFLSECLAKYHGRNVFILIDEYDVPLENAYFAGFYDEMIAFIRSFFESALKTNRYLEKGVVTGCLRISRESIFTGLNNMEADSVLNTKYGSRFGFTEAEVETMLSYYDLDSCLEEVKRWYDGYLFGDVEIYNPWSILKYVTDHVNSVTRFPMPYWSNTSSNSIVRELVDDADDETRSELEILMNGGIIEKPVHEDITYGDIHTSMDNLWNFLFLTGYLKAGRQRLEGEKLYLEMMIPNMEVKSVYGRSISTWFDRKMERTDRSPLMEALERGDCEAAEDFINDQLMDTISYYDYAESYYHGFLAGLLTRAGRYRVKSNRESGTGRPGIVISTAAIRKGRVMIIEFKVADSVRQLEAKAEEALEQIRQQQYAKPFTDEGYPVVQKYGISFYKKECVVKTEE